MSIRTSMMIATVAVLCAIFLISCDAASGTDEMISPGDQIGDFLITTGEPEQYAHTWQISCEEESPNNHHCEVGLNSGVQISNGIYADEGEDLDQLWADHTYDMTIDGRPVNLPAFGTIETDHPAVGTIRAWNVVIISPSPGTIETIHTMVESDVVTRRTITLDYDESFPPAAPPNAEETFSMLSKNVRTGRHPYSSEEAQLNYYLYIPGEYGAEPHKEWPLILLLHGLIPGSRLSDASSMPLLEQVTSDSSFPAVIVAPRGNEEYEFWAKEESMQSLDALLNEVQSTLSIDPRRIYVTGHSMGGNGTWAMGLHDPDRFAALVPASGYYGYPFTTPDNICDLKDTPIWAFHGANDEGTPLDAQQQLVEALRDCGGDVQFTVYPNAGHDIDVQVYSSQELYTWLLAQSLE